MRSKRKMGEQIKLKNIRVKDADSTEKGFNYYEEYREEEKKVAIYMDLTASKDKIISLLEEKIRGFEDEIRQLKKELKSES